MENLRWILLAAGIFFILIIYFVGRQRRQNTNSNLFDSKEDLPDFSARDWDELDEAVGEVRIVARDSIEDDLPVEQIPIYDETYEEIDENYLEQDLDSETEQESGDDLFESIDETEQPVPEVRASIENQETQSRQQIRANIDIIVLYILAKPSELLMGEKINSVAQANGFEFGRMNIYHRLDDNGQPLFSLANMIEPGNFDPDFIYDMSTTGLTIFMQLSNLAHPADAFDEMLESAYYMSEMLGATLCNQNRLPITKADAEYYRNLISEKENA